jgi:mono/diheme cytochrome c family protein
MMKKIGLLLFTAALSAPVLADVENGKELHDAECLGCHGSEAYGVKGDNIDVNDYFGLKRILSLCIQNTGKGADWFPEDQADVLEYMNSEFYHFKP